MEKEKKLRLTYLLTKGLNSDEFLELISLIDEEKRESFDKEVKKLNITTETSSNCQHQRRLYISELNKDLCLNCEKLI